MSLRNSYSLDLNINPQLSLIITEMKKIIAPMLQKNKVFDKDIAECLNIPSATFTTMKKRNSIPYQEILYWCYKMDINPLNILYKGLNQCN